MFSNVRALLKYTLLNMFSIVLHNLALLNTARRTRGGEELAGVVAVGDLPNGRMALQ